MEITLAEIKNFWNKAMLLLEKDMAEAKFITYIVPLEPITFENGVLTLKSDDFNKDTLNKKHLFEIKRCFRSVLGSAVPDTEDIDVRIVSPEDFSESKIRSAKNYANTNLRTRNTFDTFVKGKNNDLAYSAALAVAEDLGKSNYNPLFLYGGVGLGKTHLVQSIGNFVLEQNPKLKVLYQSTEIFTNEFVAAIRNNTTHLFKLKYRYNDLLILDDIQFLDAKESTQDELFYTFEELYNNEKQIVFTSDVPPKELSTLEKRLTSRFGMGLILEMTVPDYETRLAILEKKLHHERFTMPEPVKEFIVRNFVSNIRELEGALIKIDAYARLSGATITLPLAEFALKDQLDKAAKPSVNIPYIQQVVAAYYNITVADLIGRSRASKNMFPRQVAIYLSRKMLGESLPKIGKMFGGRDHTTALHSSEKIENLLEKDVHLREIVTGLERKINGE